MSELARRCGIRTLLLVMALCMATAPAPAQGLPSKQPRDRSSSMVLVDAPATVAAPLSGLELTPPGRTWEVPLAGPFFSNGLAVLGITMTRVDALGSSSAKASFDVVVTMQVWPQAAGKLAHMNLVIAAGHRMITLAQWNGAPLGSSELTSFTRRVSIDKHEFVSLFAFGARPTLHITTTVRKS